MSACHRYDEAATEFQKTLELDPNNWMIHCNLASALQNVGKYPDAVKSYENALRLNPGEIQIYLDLAETYSLAGKPAQARAMLQKGLERATAAGDAAAAEKFTARLNTAR